MILFIADGWNPLNIWDGWNRRNHEMNYLSTGALSINCMTLEVAICHSQTWPKVTLGGFPNYYVWVGLCDCDVTIVMCWHVSILRVYIYILYIYVQYTIFIAMPCYAIFSQLFGNLPALLLLHHPIHNSSTNSGTEKRSNPPSTVSHQVTWVKRS